MVSVVLPVRNGEKFLEESLKSILSQSFKKFELIIVDDASTDSTPLIIKKFLKLDGRIRAFRNSRQLGVYRTLNRAISEASYDFVARADADDIMRSDRLEMEAECLKRHKQTVVVGSWTRLVDATGKVIGERKMPVKHKEIVEMMFYAMGMQGPTLMYNRRLIPDKFTWQGEAKICDDLDLLFRLLPFGKFANIPEYLVDYRIHSKNISLKNPKVTFWEAQEIRASAVTNLGYKPSLRARVMNLAEVVLIKFVPAGFIIHLYNVFRKIFSWSL